MLQIPCPWCGLRDEMEFAYGRESHVTRPFFEVSDEEWANYLFNRENPKGTHYECWVHNFGCGRWFNVVRDTVTHEIYAAYEMGKPKPMLEEITGSDTQAGNQKLNKVNA